MSSYLRRFFFGLCLLLLPLMAKGADGWTLLRAGMSAQEARTVLGEPILATTGRGFVIWYYDHGSEVVIYNRVIAWTAPPSYGRPRQSVQAWNYYQAAPGQLPDPAPVPPSRYSSRAAAVFLPPMDFTAFRYRQRR